jgi:hypothetical protein
MPVGPMAAHVMDAVSRLPAQVEFILCSCEFVRARLHLIPHKSSEDMLSKSPVIWGLVDGDDDDAACTGRNASSREHIADTRLL